MNDIDAAHYRESAQQLQDFLHNKDVWPGVEMHGHTLSYLLQDVEKKFGSRVKVYIATRFDMNSDSILISAQSLENDKMYTFRRFPSWSAFRDDVVSKNIFWPGPANARTTLDKHYYNLKSSTLVDDLCNFIDAHGDKALFETYIKNLVGDD